MKERQRMPARRKHHWLIAGALVAALVMTALLGGNPGQFVVAQADAATVSIVPPSQIVAHGDEVTVAVEIAGADDLVAYQFTLDFNDEILSFEAVEDAGFLGDVFDVSDPMAGSLTFGATKLDPMTGESGTGTLAVVTFKAVGYGESPLTLAAVSLEDSSAEEQEAVTEDGAVIVEAQLEVLPEASKVAVGDVFTQEIMINGAVDVTAYSSNLEFDHTVVNVLSVEDAGFLGAVETTFDDSVEDVVAFGATMIDPMVGEDGSGTLVIVTLEAVGVGTSPLTLSGSRLLNSDADELTPAEKGAEVEVTASKVYVDPEEAWIYVEETGEVNIEVANAEDLVAYSFELSFDPAVVDAISVEDGGFLGAVETTFDDSVEGVIAFGATMVDPMVGQDGSGTLAVVEFEGLVIDQSDLMLSNVVLLNSAAEEQFPATEDGMIDVRCKPVTIVGELMSNSPVLLGETMHFTATVDGTAPISYAWDFDGDGEVDAEGIVDDDTVTGSFDYAAAGTYTATLTVENCDGEMDTAEIVVEVCECVEITGVETNSPVILGEPMEFTVTATGTAPIEYVFDFGDGTDPVETFESVVTHVYDEAGTYTVNIAAGNCPEAGPCVDMWPPFTVDVEVDMYMIFLPIVVNNWAP